MEQKNNMNCIHCLVHQDSKILVNNCTKKRHKFCPRYKVCYTGCNGKEYNDGIWIVDRNKKITTVVKLFEDEGFFKMHNSGFRTRIGLGSGNPIRYDDGVNFVVYFLQAGTPYSFEKIL